MILELNIDSDAADTAKYNYVRRVLLLGNFVLVNRSLRHISATILSLKSGARPRSAFSLSDSLPRSLSYLSRALLIYRLPVDQLFYLQYHDGRTLCP